ASSTRERYAEYIAERFSLDGAMNLSLAQAMAKFGGSKAGREILCYEMLKGIPVFLDTSSIWLSHLSPEGSTRSDLIEFLTARLTVGDIGEVASVIINAWRRLGKIRLVSRVKITPIWSEPAIEAFLYVLARDCPDRTMVRVDTLAGSPIVRSLLWPR